MAPAVEAGRMIRLTGVVKMGCVFSMVLVGRDVKPRCSQVSLVPDTRLYV